MSETNLQNADIFQGLRSLPYYHGFLPREDLCVLLKSEGDFLLRCSEVDDCLTTKSAQRDVILSVMAVVDKEGNNNNNPANNQYKDLMTAGELSHREVAVVSMSRMKKKMKQRRNVVIRSAKNKYYIDKTCLFGSVEELIAHYTRHPGNVNTCKFQLKNPIPQQVWEWDHSAVVLQEVLGTGAFGEVRKAQLNHMKGSMTVAVKLMKNITDLNKPKIKEMMNEARLMRMVVHPYIVQFYGVALLEQPIYIIVEFCDGGSLKDYLKSHKGKLSFKERIDMVAMAAEGVAALHESLIIHRDLAARNCLYDFKSKAVKISDFGLSRLGEVYHMKTTTKLPMKWMAPEAIGTYVFTQKTDVYSFGVLSYEILAEGGDPWEGFTIAQVKAEVAQGKVLDIPDSWPHSVRHYLINNILCHNPEKRDTMKKAAAFFSKGTKNFEIFSHLKIKL